MNIEYKIAIPSHCREEMICEKTLAYLEDCQIDPKKIYIFVTGEEEREIYEKKLPKYYNKIIAAISPLRTKRNFIRDYFEKDEYLINMDDDIDCLQRAVSTKEFQRINYFDSFVMEGFYLMEQNHCGMWGVCSHNNPFFMKQGFSLGLKYIIGGFFGIKNSKNKATYCDVENPYLEKEACEMSIKFYQEYGSVLKINNVGMKTKFYNAGGFDYIRKDIGKEKSNNDSCKYMLKKYPDYVYLKKGTENGHMELALKNLKPIIKNKWW